MRLETRLRSTAMRLITSEKFLEFKRNTARLKRILTAQPQMLHYFHEVDDPYSFIVVQHLDHLKARFTTPLNIHLVNSSEPEYKGDAALFTAWSYNDAANIAPFYGQALPASISELTDYHRRPKLKNLAVANIQLAALSDKPNFVAQALSLAKALWQNTELADESLTAEQAKQKAQQILNPGNRLMKALGHYRGGAFYFEGEWFWGVDRIQLLCERLTKEGFAIEHAKNEETSVEPARKPLAVTQANASSITLEYFPSLRSPYTAIGHQAVVDLVRRSGVQLQLKPVLPMLMRGIPAPRDKQQYIAIDCAREARAKRIPFGNFVDPLGEPVKKAFALYPGALSLGHGLEFISAYLSASFAHGIDIDSIDGLKHVVANADLEWEELQIETAKFDWQQILEDNLQSMLGAGLWGVPSFRVSGGNKDETFSCWGQDRIWRVEHEIAQRIL